MKLKQRWKRFCKRFWKNYEDVMKDTYQMRGINGETIYVPIRRKTQWKKKNK